MLYRVKQFIWAIGAGISSDDKKFINKYLTFDEMEIFNKLSISEQAHSIRVARDVLLKSQGEKQSTLLVKAAILHDVGKINSGLNIINKSIITISNRVFPKLTRSLSRFKCINAYYNHPSIAVRYLKNQNEYVLYLILNHHNYKIKNDKGLSILQESDSRN